MLGCGVRTGTVNSELDFFIHSHEMNTAADALLKLTSISKSFGGVRALEGVSLELFAGEVHALIGENGAGKSTLIKIITGAVEADAGSLQIQGRIVERNDPATVRGCWGSRRSISNRHCFRI